MNCPLKTEETAGMLLDYTARRLDPGTAVMLERHMLVCAECAAVRREQTEVWNALDAWEPAPVSVDFNRRLWQRIDAVEAEPWYVRLRDSLRVANWKPAFPLAAAILMIAAGFVMDHREQRYVANPPGVSASEVEQVEQTLEDLQLLHQFDSAAGSAAKQM